MGEVKAEVVQGETGGDIHGVTGEVKAPPASCLGPLPQAADDSKSS